MYTHDIPLTRESHLLKFGRRRLSCKYCSTTVNYYILYAFSILRYSRSEFIFLFFFFSSRRRHTRLQGDWSSDVCSSDLVLAGTTCTETSGATSASFLEQPEAAKNKMTSGRKKKSSWRDGRGRRGFEEIGRASCRERV